MSDQKQIHVEPGQNLWRLLRTNRDGASEAEVRRMTGPAMFRFLREAHQTEEPWEYLETGDGEFRMGAARPVVVEYVGKESAPLPAGDTLANRQKGVVDTIPTVRGANPWWILVRIHWRGPQASIPYPALRVDWLGARHYELNGADWVLDKAVAVAPEEQAEDPGDETWGDVQAKKAGRLLKTGGAVVLTVGAAAAVAAVLLARRKRNV